MPDFITVASRATSVGIVACHDCSAAWLQTDEFVAACPKCSSVALDEYDAIPDPAGGNAYIAIEPVEGHLI